MTEVIRIEALTKEYRIGGGRKLKAIDNLNLEVERGEIFALLGPNGAGKTTALNIMLGFGYQTSGTVIVLGKKAGDVAARSRLSFLAEFPASYEYLNVEELLHFYGALFGMKRKERIEKIEKLLDLVGLNPEIRRRKLSELSKGLRQRVAIAESLLNDPELLLMDEPESGLDPMGRREVRKLLVRLKDEGKTIFLCSHLLSEMEKISTRIGIMHEGRLLKAGKIEELLAVKGQSLEDLFIEIVEGSKP